MRRERSFSRRNSDVYRAVLAAAVAVATLAIAQPAQAQDDPQPSPDLAAMLEAAADIGCPSLDFLGFDEPTGPSDPGPNISGAELGSAVRL